MNSYLIPQFCSVSLGFLASVPRSSLASYQQGCLEIGTDKHVMDGKDEHILLSSHVLMCTHAEVPGDHWVPCSVLSHPIPLRWGLSLNPEFLIL